MQHRQLKAPGFASPRAARAGAALLLAALLVALPAVSRAGLEFRSLRDPREYLHPLDGASNGLPAYWRISASGATAQNGYGDPTVSVSVDPITGLVRETYIEDGVEVRSPLVASEQDYNSLLTVRNSRRMWKDKFRQTRSFDRQGIAARGGMFRLALPVVLPKAVRSIVGDGAPNLEVTGSETITLAGTSDWTVGNSIYTGERKKQGAFPSFEMKQELNVNLTGSIGDKIKVDVDQSSNVQTSLDNKVKLRYEGDEDDMIKSVELGNTNLSLQGASIRQEGLFGVKTAAKLGNVDVVTIASKQEGKNETARFTPSGDKTQVIVRDVDYIKHQFFSLTDHFALIDYKGEKAGQKLEVYKKNIGTVQGTRARGLLDPNRPRDADNPSTEGTWKLLTLGTEYTVEENWWKDLPGGLKVPVIRLLVPLSDPEVLGVAYTETTNGRVAVIGTGAQTLGQASIERGDSLTLKVLKIASSDFKLGADGQYQTSDPWYPTLQYELRNFYNLGARNIETSTMTLKVRKRDESQAVNPDQLDQTPFIQILGLDQRNTTGEPGADGKVDLQLVDAENGILFFPDLTPFAPRFSYATLLEDSPPVCGPDSFALSCLNNYSNAANPRVKLNTLTGDTANVKMYSHQKIDPSTDNRFYIEGEFQSSRAGYYLGRFNILEGSEVVKVDGVPYRRDSDYIIDYDTGQLTFLKPPGPNQVVSVDYSFAPGAGQVQRTLLGFSTSYNPASNLSFSSSLLYESKGAQEDLVKLGEEPATSLIGDLSSVLAFRPNWMTQLANRIPGIATSAQSALNIQGGISASVPDPNTKGEAYVDDMEGNRESNTIPLSRVQWLYSSVPLGDSLSRPDTLVANHGRLHWYNPVGDDNDYAVKEHDLKPTLKDEEGGKNQRQVLALDVDTTATVTPNMWTGITVPLGSVGQDLSRVQYFEIWINDFRRDHTLTEGKIHFDFGRISEDAFWDPRNPPNGRLDTEDKNGDGRLDRRNPDDPDFDAIDEDTGLDGLHDGQESGSGPDPNGDDYAYDANDPKKRDDYSKINNLEGNAINDPNARPDTEDLNRDGGLDLDNDYFERSLDLTDTNYVAIDVPKEYAGFPVVDDRKVANGWRLYRIPIDSVSTRVGSPSWSNVQAVRIWIDGMQQPLRLQVGGIELIGSRWLRQAVRDPLFYQDRDFLVLAKNNKDDPDYVPPYDVKHQVGITADRREQSLALRYGRVGGSQGGTQSPDTLLAFKTYGDVGNAVGWTLYQEIRFYVHGDAGVEAQKARAIARFGPDTVNYYEYSVPLRSGWQSVVIPMERLSGLKERPRTAADSVMVIDRETGAASGEVYAVRGNPSFTRVNRVSFGLAFDSTAARGAQGEVWFDDLRVSAVRKDRGFSSNVTVQANFADLLSLNGSFTQQDKDFFRVGLGANQGTGFDHTATGLSSTLNLDRFMPASGVQLPVRVSMQHSLDVPKFRTGSDVILDPSRQDIERRESNSQSIDLSYNRTSPKKGIARYTLDAINGRLSYTRDGSVNPQSADSSWSFITNTSYSVPIGFNGLKVGPVRLNPVPRTLTVAADWISTRRVSYSRAFTDSGTVVQDLRSDVKQRLLTLRMDTSVEPINGVRMTYRLNSQRDMLLHQDDFFGFNRGTEIRHEQNVGLNYRPRWLTFLQPEIDLKGQYSEDGGPTVRLLATDPPNLKRIQNSGTAHTNITIPLSRFGGRRGAPNDTSGSFSPLAPLRFLFSKMQDLSATFDLSRSAGLDRVTGDPGFAFKTGFTEVFDDRLGSYSNSTISTARRYSTRANTSFRPLDKLSFDIHGDYQLQFTDQVGGAVRTASTAWPDVNARWVDLQRLLGLNATLTTLTLNSWYVKKTQESGPPDGDVDQRVETTSLNPLLGWDARFRSGVNLTAASGLDKTRSTDNRAANFFRDRSNKSTRLAVNKNFPASKGIKFPWSKKRVRLPNDLNLGIQADIGSSRTIVHQPPFPETVEEDRGTLNVGSSTNYNFSQSIAGGFNLAFRQTTDRKLNIIQRGITMSFTGTFRF